LQLTSFIGREREMSEVNELLVDKTRLLTLTGPGGCGKTRLALAVANDLVEEFEDGVWLVELASLSDPALVPQAVASALGVREQPRRPMTETLLDHLRPKKLLLVLDNCEHLIGACAGLADGLLRACPELRILATSREPLRIDGETVWLVPSLSLPDPRHRPPVDELPRYEAVRLFAERAGAALSSFALTEENAPAVARLCRRLEGMPLAIELAASRVKVLSVEQIAERLDDCFRLLRGGSRVALPRHRTLRATIDWSHGLLSEEEQALFRRLSVFAGGFSLEAAEAVCGGEGIEKDEVLDLLSQLVDKSLVLMAEEDSGETRYRLLEMVRQYGKEKLDESGEAQAIRGRHASFFLRLTEEAEPAILGPGQVAWLERLEREHDDLRAGLGWLRQEGAVERGLRLGGALGHFWFLRGYYTEGRAWLEAFLEFPEAFGRTAARAKALYALGMLIYRSADYSAGDQDVAHSRLEEGLKIYRELGDGPRTAAVLRELGHLGARVGDWEAARSALEESLILERRSGNEHGIAVTRNLLGHLALLRGEYEPARAHLEESLGILRRLGDKFYLNTCSYFLGLLACEQGEYAEARDRFAEVVLEGDPFRWYRYTGPFVLQAYARLAAGEGHPKRALRLAGAADALRQTIGTSLGPTFQAYFRRGLEPAWKALSGEGGKVAWEEGRAMTLEEAVECVVDEAAASHEEDAYPSIIAKTALAEVKNLPELKIFALGQARVERGEHALAPSEWTYLKSRELLFYLLSHPSRTKAQVGLALWPEASPSQLRRTFHATLHHLRRALGRSERIVFEKGRYAFDRSLPYWYDVEAFESKLAEARRLLETEAPTREAISYLKEAVGLYGGDFLEDSAEGEWTLIRQEELRRAYQEALLTLGGLLFGEGRYGEAVEAYRKAVEHDAYLEASHRELMRCYARLGERGQALRHYQTLVELLRKELGSSPAPGTTELYRRLRQGEDV
jgi:predicted ATPase/two-component SAPR family response regulator